MLHQFSSSAYRVVYPKGDRTQLTVAFVIDYEVDDWAIASSQEFQEETLAIEHMKILGQKNGLKFKGDNHSYLLD